MATKAVIVGIDTGGTFTDLVAFTGTELRTHKVLSTPSNPAEAVLKGLAQMLDGGQADIVTYGSTVATNALLERRGARVLLLTTSGFEDVIEIGRQNRPLLYDLEPRRIEPLVARPHRIGIAERVTFDGRVLVPLTGRALRTALGAIARQRAESVAVCFLHSYANSKHERLVGKALMGVLPCSLSHELVCEYREYERLSTTVINAYVRPVMSHHLALLERGLHDSRLRVMQSNGGAISAQQASHEAVRTVLSGPAAGVIGAWNVARSMRTTKVITFDMGGTSTDVSLINGAPSQRTEWEIGGLPIKVPALDIHTVGAGGGSVATIDDGGALKVGPESAGADPGPACYGKGTRATVTDANVLLGRLAAGEFLGGRMSLDQRRARRALAALGKKMRISSERVAEGVVRIANASMERAIRRVSVERGHDPREYTLIAFGGAAGQHACELAAALGIRRVIAPAHPGLLSAWGAAFADVQRDYVRTVRLIDPPQERVRRVFRSFERTALRALRDEGVATRDRQLHSFLDLRYCGQSYEIRLPFAGNYLQAFHREHEALYGYCDRDRAVEIVNIRLHAIGKGPRSRAGRAPSPVSSRPRMQRVRWDGRWLQSPMRRRESLRPEVRLRGPLIITEFSATNFVPPGWNVTLRRSGHLEMVDGN